MSLDFGDITLFFNGKELSPVAPAFEISPPLDGTGAVEQKMGRRFRPIETAEDLQAVLNGIEFRGALALLKTRFLVSGEYSPYGFRAYAVISAPERDGVEAIEISQSVIFHKPVFVATLLHQVRDELARLLLHELAEGIVVAGIRPFDPHR